MHPRVLLGVWVEGGSRVLNLLAVESLLLALDRTHDGVTLASQLDICLVLLLLEMREELVHTVDLIAPALKVVAIVEAGLPISLIQTSYQPLTLAPVELELVPVALERRNAHRLQPSDLLLDLLILIRCLEDLVRIELVAVVVEHWLQLLG